MRDFGLRVESAWSIPGFPMSEDQGLKLEEILLLLSHPAMCCEKMSLPSGCFVQLRSGFPPGISVKPNPYNSSDLLKPNN